MQNQVRKYHDSKRCDGILRFFSPPKNQAIFSAFWVISLLDYTEYLEKQRKSTGENSKNPARRRALDGPMPV